MATQLPNMKMSVDRVDELWDSLHALARREILVGFPEETTSRDDAGTPGGEPTNAALGYIHDNGSPEVNIPARPFMLPGMDSVKDTAANRLRSIALKVLRFGPKDMVEQGWHSVGLTVQAGIRKYINQGISPPLSEYTLRERARRGRKGAKQELANRAAGLAPSTQLAKPLIDTGQLRNALNYVIRNRKRR